jgi:hypothetical protein
MVPEAKLLIPMTLTFWLGRGPLLAALALTDVNLA